MKKILLTATLMAGTLSFAQAVSDQVGLQPGYTNQVYYSLENGEVSNITNDDWDLAFDLSGFGTGIRVNNQLGTTVYVASTDTADWNNLDTTGMSTWNALYNSDQTWTDGALNMDFDSNNANDIGWGIYNSITHHIIGNRLFVMQMTNDSVKKLWIQSVIGGDYIFRIANLDNTDDFSQTVTKSAYSGKNFVYYSIDNNTIIDREPLSADWDLVFTKYMGQLGPGVHYGVTGVLSNMQTEVAEATGDIVENLTFGNNYTFTTDINTIGYDWKSYSFAIGGFVIADSTAYFVKTAEGDYWKVVMTDFLGSSSGEVMFTKEKTGTASVNNSNTYTYTAYPNPTTGTFRIKADHTLEAISVYNSNGQMIYAEDDILNTIEISLDNLPNGMYFINTTSTNGKVSTQKIVKI